MKRYDLSYTSNNPKIAQVYKTGKVKSFKQGNVIITCKNADKSNFASFNIEVKCNHEKNPLKQLKQHALKQELILMNVKFVTQKWIKN